MNLRNWLTNSPVFRQHIPAEKKDENSKVSLLGLQWDTLGDTLAVKAFKPAESEYTLKKILSATASIYDPLGFFAPVTVVAKMFVQDLQIAGASWDTHISPEKTESWSKLQFSLQDVVGFPITRPVLVTDDIYELHVFSDASVRVYAAAAYISSVRSEKVTLVFAKAKIVKPDLHTVPRMELLGILLAVRILRNVRAAVKLQFEKQIVWSDSTTALFWSKKYKTDVSLHSKSCQNYLRVPGHQT